MLPAPIWNGWPTSTASRTTKRLPPELPAGAAVFHGLLIENYPNAEGLFPLRCKVRGRTANEMPRIELMDPFRLANFQ